MLCRQDVNGLTTCGRRYRFRLRTSLIAAFSRASSAYILCLLFIHPPAHGSEVSPAARNTLDSARIPRASKLLICGLFLKGRVLAQDGVAEVAPVRNQSLRQGHRTNQVFINRQLWKNGTRT